MNLCCFRIRDIAKRAGDHSILVKLDRMEKAVTRMATQLEGYSRARPETSVEIPGKRIRAYSTKTSIGFSNAVAVANSTGRTDYAMQTSIPN